MLARQRQSLILDEVRRHGGVRVSDLTAALAVSDMTVRRDLEELARRGLVDKVHGGAVMPGGSADEPGFEAKSARERHEKDLIAAAAAALVGPGQAIALSAGTTTWTLARHLVAVPGLTVVTNSVSVAEVFRPNAQHNGQTVVLTGGTRTPSDALVGPLADAAIRSLNVDVLFLGVHGMDPRAGFTTPNLAEAQTNRTFLSHARRVVVLADSTKWRTIGLAGFGPLSAADVLVTDGGIAGTDTEAREVLEATVGELVVVPAAPAGTRPAVGDNQSEDAQ